MSPEKQRIAIAEACGWRKAEPPNTPVWWKNGEWVSNVYDLPDYLNDLNAMHEAEKVLTKDRHAEFVGWLSTIQFGFLTVEEYEWATIHATAAQRAEAFLRTIGKWEESTKETTK
jgi:hypothetical protein